MLTIPSLIPPEGHTYSTELYTPFQSLGARGVNALASKLLLTLLPPSAPFFRLVMSEKVLGQMRPEDKALFDAALGKSENRVIKDIETRSIRVYAFEMLKHLIVSGNVLIHLPNTGGMRVFPLANFVCRRDSEGNVLEIVVKELVAPNALPKEIQEEAKEDLAKAGKEDVELYTHIRRGNPFETEVEGWDNPGKWYVRQEVCGMYVPGSGGEYPLDKCPWLALRWTRIDGENYGRGYCEEYLGDLKSLEALEKAIVEGAAIAARVLFLVNPNGTTDIEDLNEAPNGATRPGNKEEVGAVQTEKQADFNIASKEIDRIETRLSYVFLLHSAIQRNGERVTAEEIRYMASELESTLGGVYSVLSVEFQLPLVNLIMAQLQRIGEMPKLPKNAVTPAIVTGVDALGRNQELQRLQSAVATIVQTIGPEAFVSNANIPEYILRVFTASGVDTKALIKSPEQIQEEQQAAMKQQMMEKLGPAGIKAVSDQALHMTPQAAQQPQPQG
jgi:hypothetical protein